MSRKTVILYTFILFLAGNTSAKDLNFTFGNPSYPPPPGYSKITAGLIYSKSNGYGWLRQCARNGGPYKDAKTEETKTSCGCLPDEKTAPLRIDMPDGVYMVKAYLGHVTPTEGRKVCMAINGKTVIAPPGAGGWGTVATPSVPAVVENGKMDIVFYTAKDGRIEVFTLEIKEIKDKADSEKMQRRFMELPDYTGNSEITTKAPELFSISGKKLVEVARRQEVAPGSWIEKYKGQKALIFTRSNQGAILDYSIPRENEIITSIGTFTACGEKASAYMGVYANEELANAFVSISDLKNGNSVLSSDSITIFKVTSHPQSTTDRAGIYGTIVPELFEKNTPFTLNKGKTQPFYIRFSTLPDIVPGIYKGKLSVTANGKKITAIEIELNVLNLKLDATVDKSWLICPDANRWLEMPEAMIDKEIKDMTEHGINGFIIALAPIGGAFSEKNGHFESVNLGKTGTALNAAKKYINGKPELVMAVTTMTAAHLRGWKIDQKGETERSSADSEGKKCLVLTNKNDKASSSVLTDFFAFMDGGQALAFSVDYRLNASKKAIARVMFYDRNRIPVKPAELQIKLSPTNGNIATEKASVTLPANAVNYLVSIDFAGAAGTLELYHAELSGSGGVRNYITNPDFERPIEKQDLNKPWPANFITQYIEALNANADAAKALGFTPMIEGKDEAGNDAKDEFSEISELKYAKEGGLTTFCNISPALAEKAKDYLDVICFYASSLGDEKSGRQIISDFQKLGKKVYYIGAGSYVTQDDDIMTNRFGTGAFLWKNGCDGTYIWTYQRYSGSPFDDFDGPYHDYCLVYPPRNEGDSPITTNAWEGVMEGWLDYRYFKALENEVEKAEKAGRKDTARKGRMVVDFIRKAIPWYSEFTCMSFDSATANDLRWFAAWATMKLQNDSFSVGGAAQASKIRLSIPDDFQIILPEEGTEDTKLVPPTQQAPEIDGMLNDDAWKNSLTLGEFRNYMNPAIKVTANTVVMMLHDKENIYIGFRCYEENMKTLKASEKKRDGNVFADDCIEMFFDTANNSRDFFQLCFNPAGTRFDLRGSGSRNTSGSSIFAVDYKKEKIRDASWNGDWTVKTSRHSDRWEAEVKIPFSTIGRSNDVWGVQFGRNRRSAIPETSSSKAIGYFDQPEFYGRIILAGGRDGKTVLKKWETGDFKFGPTENIMEFSPDNDVIVKTETDGKNQKEFQSISGKADIAYDIDNTSKQLAVCVESNAKEKAFEFRFPLVLKDAVKTVQGKPLLYTGQSDAEFEAEINVSDLLEKSGKLRCTVISNGKALKSIESKLANGIVRLNLETTGLGEGFYTLKLDVIDKSGNILSGSIYDFAIIPNYIK